MATIADERLSITKPPEAQLLAVVKNNPDGPLDMLVASVSGWHFAYEEYTSDPADVRPDELDEWEKWELKPNRSPDGTIFTPPEKDMWEKEFAKIFVGPGRALRIPQVKYSKWEKKEGKTDPELVSKDRTDSPFFFFQYNMAIPATKVEIEGNFTIDLVVNTMVRLRNPYKAEFLAGAWESLFNAAVQAKIREYVGNKDFSALRTEHEQGNTGLVQQIKSLNDNAPNVETPGAVVTATAGSPAAPAPEDGLTKKFGVEIIDVRFVKFDIITKEQRIKDALTAKQVNKLNADAALDKKQEIITLAEGEAKGAELITKAYGSGEAAAMVRSSELIGRAIENTKAEFVSINSPGLSAAVPFNKKDRQNPSQDPEQPPKASGSRPPRRKK